MSDKENKLPSAIMTADEVMEKMRINETELRRMIKSGRLPRPFIFDGKRCFKRGAVTGEEDNRKVVERAVIPGGENNARQ